MTSTSKLTIVILAFLVLTASAYAQSPREQLNQMVQQLQKTPNDNALREKIIRLGAEIKPAPAIPEEANRSFVRGNVFQKEAKDASGYELAISAYRDALRVAPWWGDAYFNLAGTLESAGKFDEAIASFKLSMISVPAGSAEAREAHNRIYATEAKSEMASKQAEKVATEKRRAAEEANSPQAREAALLSKVEGARFVYRLSRQTTGFPGTADEIFEIKDRMLHITLRIHSIEPPASMYGHRQPGEFLVDRISYRDGAFAHTHTGGRFTTVYRIRPDAQALTVQYHGNSSSTVEIPRN